MTYQEARRCARAQMARAASYLEHAKYEPTRFDYWYALAVQAEKRASKWIAEAEKKRDENLLRL